MRGSMGFVKQSLRRLVGIAALAAALVAALPVVVVAECNGPVCGPMDAEEVAGPEVLIFLVILMVLATAMAVAEARRG